ncbi:hypothetical protein BH23PLA1_BH23PLA1_44770 [soil metagenome]
MARDSDWFISERIRALAIMHLTRRADLIVREEAREPDKILDLVVDIIDPAKPGRRRFGVYLQGTKSPVTIEHANTVLRPSMARFRAYGEVPYPFCLFYFTMEDNKGYFTWTAEPMIDDEGRPRLRYHEAPHCTEIDREVLDQIVDKVNAWYDAFYITIKA